MLFSADTYYTVMAAMVAVGFVVFFVLLRVNAGYGMMYDRRWGPSLPNRLGWVLMELPAFACLVLIWATAPGPAQPAAAVCALLFLAHYFQRTFIFPMLMRGKSRMPLLIMVFGMVFNTINAYLIGGWLFRLAPVGSYGWHWLGSWQFICGTILFLAGAAVNLHSDHIVRHLRKPGDTRHYIPKGGMFRYVSSANYLGELIEWCGYALLTWSLAGVVFAYWTFANLAPRARALHKRYLGEFGEEYARLNRKCLIPFIF